MGISRKTAEKWSALSTKDQERIVRMAWEDRSTFDDIQTQFDLSPNEVEQFMRTQLEEKDYRRWRKRASEQGQLKHKKTRPKEVDRFKCSRQRMDGSTKGWK